VPLTLELVRQGVIDEQQFVRLLSVNPARILNVPGGSLSAGRPADVSVIDPAEHFVYTADSVMSKSRNSPFLGRSLQGRAVMTLVDGRVRFSRPR